MTLTFDEACALCWETRAQWFDAKPDGQQTIRINLNHVRRIIGGDTLIDTVKPSTFAKLGRHLQAEGKANGTCNRVMSALHTVLMNAHLEDELDSVPSYKRFKEPPGMTETYTKDEILTLMEKALELKEHGVLMQRSLVFLYYSGARRGSMLELRWVDTNRSGQQVNCIDFENNKIWLLDTKTSTDFALAMHPDLRVMLMEMHKERLDDDLVFPWHHRDTFNRAMRNLKKLTGLGGRRPTHQIRHSVASHLLKDKTELKVIQSLLGHASYTTTLRYAHTTEDMITEAVNTLQLNKTNETINGT